MNLLIDDTPLPFAGRRVLFEMDRNLDTRTALAIGSNGLQLEFIRVPRQRPPEWAVKVVLSVEDYGQMLRLLEANALFS